LYDDVLASERASSGAAGAQAAVPRRTGCVVCTHVVQARPGANILPQHAQHSHPLSHVQKTSDATVGPARPRRDGTPSHPCSQARWCVHLRQLQAPIMWHRPEARLLCIRTTAREPDRFLILNMARLMRQLSYRLGAASGRADGRACLAIPETPTFLTGLVPHIMYGSSKVWIPMGGCPLLFGQG
jgi:hypothetical protein